MKWVLLDFSFLAHRARLQFIDLNHKGEDTGVMFGLLNQIISLWKNPRVGTNNMLIFCDDARSLRQEQYFEYKKKRKKDRSPEELEQIKTMYEQIDKLREYMPSMGFVVYKQEGLESDDIMAQAAKQLEASGHEVQIVTSDGDLNQCITNKVTCFDPLHRRSITRKSFIDDKGIDPNKWGEVKSLAGCTTDNVPGIRGIGEKKAIRWVKGELPPGADSDKIERAIETGYVAEMAKLVVLPHAEVCEIDIREPDYNFSNFVKFCKKYGMLSMLRNGTQAHDWKTFFNTKGKRK